MKLPPSSIIVCALFMAQCTHDDGLPHRSSNTNEEPKVTEKPSVTTDRVSVDRKKVNAAVATIGHFEFHETPLDDALAFLSQAYAVQFDIDDKALRTLEIDRDEPVSVSLSDKRLGEALEAMLSPLGLVYIIQEDRIVITSQTQAGISH